MDRSHNPNQSNSRFGFVQNSGVHYGTGTGQNFSRPGQNLSTPGQSLTTPGQSLTTPGQNFSTPGQILPQPPPLVRHGLVTSSAIASTAGNFNAALEGHFRRSLNPYTSANVASRNGSTVPASIGNSMGGSSIPNQSNTVFGYPNPGQAAQQYGTSWRGQSTSDVSHLGTSAGISGGQMFRQGLPNEYDISLMQQNKPSSYVAGQGQGQIAAGQSMGQPYRYGSVPNQMNIRGTVRERMDPRFPSSCHMPNNSTTNVQAGLRQSAQNFMPDFSSYADRHQMQGYGANTNQFSINQGIPPAHQNGQRIQPAAHQQQPGTSIPPAQSYSNVNSRQAQVSSSYGMISPAQRPYQVGSMQGHFPQGQGHIGMTSGQSYNLQGQNVFDINPVQRGQDNFVQGQSNIQGHNLQQTTSVSGGKGLPSSMERPEKFLNIIEATASLFRLSSIGDSASKLRLMHLKDKLEKSGMLSPGESLPSFLAKYAIRGKNRLIAQQQQTPAVNPNMAAKTPGSESVVTPGQPMRGQDASAIQSAFAVPQSQEAHDKTVLGRWYAPPSAQTGVSAQLPRPASSPSCNIDNNTRQSVTVATATPTTSVSANPSTEPFVLKPSICSDDIIEYKVADLLRCLPRSVRSRHTSSVDSNKNSEKSTSDIDKVRSRHTSSIDSNKSSEKSTNDIDKVLEKEKPENEPDENQQRKEPTSPITQQSSGTSVEAIEKETGKNDSREGTPGKNDSREGTPGKNDSREGTPWSDEQFLGPDSLFDKNKQRLFDQLVLDSQFGTQDMNPEIDYRNYLPSPGLPADFAATPSPVERNSESPFLSRNTDSLADTDSDMVARRQSEENVAPCQTDSDVSKFKNTDEEIPADETGDLPEPSVEIDRDESPVRIGKKRKHSCNSDGNFGKLTPPVKRQRGRGRGIGQGRGTRGRGKGRGRAWGGNITPISKPTKPVRGKKRQAARATRGRRRVGRPKLVSTVNTSPVAETECSSDRPESPSVSGLDGQVIQKPQDLKKLMDNLPHEELEKATVSLSTLKMMLAWTEAKANAGSEEEDEESDAVSVASAGDDTEDMDTHDLSSELNNKEHNRYEPPVADIDEKSREGIEDVPKSEDENTEVIEKDKQDIEVKSPVKVSGEKVKNTSDNTGSNENEKESEVNENQNKDSVDNEKSERRKEADDGKAASDVVPEIKEKHNTSEDDIQGVKSKEQSNAETRIPIRVHSVTDTHKMTWVRYHGRAVTHLRTPEGNFFIMKEILRRCFRIQEPDKSLKFSKIGILKRKVLKIPDTELEPLFYDYVVKNLVERKVIRTIPEKFIIISEEDANRLFHYVCKDQYCGSSCVTPFYQNRATSASKQSEIKTSEVSDTSQEAKAPVKKDRNLFDFIESETVSPKVEKKSPGKKRKRHPSSEVINLCSDDEESNGYDSDKTLPYVDGRPSSMDELKELGTSAMKLVTQNKTEEKESSDIKKASSESNVASKKVLVNVPEDTTEKEKLDKRIVDKTGTLGSESQVGMKGNSDNMLNKCNSGKEIIQTKSATNLPETIETGKNSADKSSKESNSDKLNKNSEDAAAGKPKVKEINNVHGSSTGDIRKSKVSDDEIIVIDDDEEEKGDEGNVICLLTLEKMKKEIGSGTKINQNVTERESLNSELVQVHNIDSTAVCADKDDQTNTGERSEKIPLGRTEKLRVTDSVTEKEKSVTGIDCLSDKSFNDVNDVLRPGQTVDMAMDLDDYTDVTIGEWVFPAPPKTYPEDGSKKLEEANDTLQKIIERANNAKKTEDYVDVLDHVFKLREPLKQWTNTLFDHYEEGLLIEAQRLKSLDQLKLKDISNTIDLDDDDVEMESSRGNDIG